jgi:hypothetical protein
MKPYTGVILSLLALGCASAQPKASPSSLPSEARSGIVTQVAELLPTDGTANGGFGISVAISEDANTIAVGAFENAHNRGAIYVFVKPASGWQSMTQTAELTVSGVAARGLGYPIAMSPDGNTIVGNGIETTSPDGPGEVFVFVKPAGGWKNMTQTATLYAQGGGNIGFGNHTATDGNNILVGATGCGGNGDFSSGAAYLFVKPATGWTTMTETGRLGESDPVECDDYGSSMVIQDGTAVVGRTGAGMTPPVVPGSLYVFTEPASGWQNMTQTAKLTTTTEGYYGIGGSVALSGNTILAPAFFSTNGAPSAGAYIFTQPAGGWVNMTQTAILTNATPGVSIGSPTALDGGTAAVSAHTSEGNFITLYYEPANGWQSTSVPNVTLNRSASAVALSGGTVVAGSENTGTGVAYVFETQ